MLRQYFSCNERLEIFLTCFCNNLCYVGTCIVDIFRSSHYRRIRLYFIYRLIVKESNKIDLKKYIRSYAFLFTTEVIDYAKRLGIDPDAEPHLLDLAREGLMAPLPKGWRPYHDEATGAYYYYEASTRTTTWEHPLDARNRQLVEKARASFANRQLLNLGMNYMLFFVGT